MTSAQNGRLPSHKRHYEAVCAELKKKGFQLTAKWKRTNLGLLGRHELTATDRHLGEKEWWVPEYHTGEKPRVEMDVVPPWVKSKRGFEKWQDECASESQAWFQPAPGEKIPELRELTAQDQFAGSYEEIRRELWRLEDVPGDWEKVAMEAKELLDQAVFYMKRSRIEEENPFREDDPWAALQLAVDAGMQIQRLKSAALIPKVLRSVAMTRGKEALTKQMEQIRMELLAKGIRPSAKRIVEYSGGRYEKKEGGVAVVVGGPFADLSAKAFRDRLRRIERK